VLIPAGIMLALYATPVVDLLLKRGAFDERAAALTAETLSIIALGLVFYAPVIVGHRALMAATASRTIAVLETVSAAVLIATAVSLGPLFHNRGLALAYAVVAALSAALYSRETKRRFDVGLSSAILGAFARRAVYAIAAATLSLGAYAAVRLVGGGEALALVVAVALALPCYVALHHTERDSELLAALASLSKLAGRSTSA